MWIANTSSAVSKTFSAMDGFLQCQWLPLRIEGFLRYPTRPPQCQWLIASEESFAITGFLRYPRRLWESTGVLLSSGVSSCPVTSSAIAGFLRYQRRPPRSPASSAAERCSPQPPTSSAIAAFLRYRWRPPQSPASSAAERPPPLPRPPRGVLFCLGALLCGLGL